MKNSPKARVALLIDTSTSWGRDVIQGIAAYSREKCQWQLYLEPHGFGEAILPPHWWDGDGIIARVHDTDQARLLKQRDIPIVNLSATRIPEADMPRTIQDEEKAINLALDHFWDLGLRVFAYAGDMGDNVPRPRPETFRRVVEGRGGQSHIFKEQPLSLSKEAMEDYVKALSRWVRALPKPVGVVARGVTPAPLVIQACRLAGFDVPREVAVVGVDADDLLAKTFETTISTVDMLPKKQGYESARLLDGLMRGKPMSTDPILVQPLGIISRQSSDIMMIEDQVLRLAMRFIQRNAADPITVEDVAAHAKVHRHLLDQRFRKHLGGSPAEEIRRTRIDMARRLLAHSSLPVSEIALQTGFSSEKHFYPAFKKMTGQTPLQYRRQVFSAFPDR